MNIYEMYHENNCSFGFFIIRDNWGNTVAKVISIDGVIEGKRINGRPPYFRNPKVMGEFYRIEDAPFLSKETIVLNCNKENLVSVSEISCPGTYSYETV